MTISFDFPPPIPLSPFILGVGLFQKRPPTRASRLFASPKTALCKSLAVTQLIGFSIRVCLSSNLPEHNFSHNNVFCFIANYSYNCFFFFRLIKLGADSSLLSIGWEDLISARIDSVYGSTFTSGVCEFKTSPT